MELNDFERSLFLDLAFFAEDSSFESHDLRPVSLASFKAMEIMGIKLMELDPGLSVEEETQQIAAFIWLHGQPLPAVCSALWSGRWRVVMESFNEPMPSIVAAFRQWRIRIVAMIHAASINIRPRPKKVGAKDDSPRDLVGPSQFAFTIGTIASYTHFSRQEIKWHIFLPEAMQYYHAALRDSGYWTVPVGRRVTEEDVSDLVPDFLKGAVDTGQPP
ncbi:hypothetical protein [Verrucomicrobium spinosum]|uniref:hypothetical protein n=1 Tax=Verrucomicrobium spinosum TaxID=2736 RepID=UPI0001746882|nr:hypothetical protein [Verrucomicrobium spinosum]